MEFASMITAIGSVVTPVILVVMSVFGWKYQKNIERRIDVEKSLRGDRTEVYNAILEPYITFLTPDAVWARDKANKGKNKNEIASGQLLSTEYRKASFKLVLLGDDAVVKAFLSLVQSFYNTKEDDDLEVKLANMLLLLGNLLLEIRRSMGSEATSLDNWDMIRWIITDTDKVKAVIGGGGVVSSV